MDRGAQSTSLVGRAAGSATREASATVKSAGRVLDILELITVEPIGLRFPEIADRLGLPRSSLHALLITLENRRWLTLDEESRRYRIGIKAWETGHGFAEVHELAALAEPFLRAAQEDLHETVQLAILDDVEVVYIAKVDADRPFRLASRVGMRLPAYATGLGKVLLAALPDGELDRRLNGVAFERFTDRTIVDREELKATLVNVRGEGVGRDVGEYTAYVYCVAAPVLSAGGDVVAAMSCSVPEQALRSGDRSESDLVRAVAKHALALSNALGWPGTVATRT